MTELTPSDGELRAAGVELRLARFRADFEVPISATRRGRLALRISHWYARRNTTR